MLTTTYCLPAIAKVLTAIKVGVPVTPSQINKAAGNGDYAAKYIMLMRKYYGFDITVQKNGKSVVSYTVVREPENVAELRAYTGREKTSAKAPAKTKAAKPAATKSAKKTKTPEQIKAANLATMKKVGQKQTKNNTKVNKIVDEVENSLGTTGEIATSYSIDHGWDAIDQSVLPAFLR